MEGNTEEQTYFQEGAESQDYSEGEWNDEIGEGIGEVDESGYDQAYDEGMIIGSDPKPMGGIYALFDTVLNKSDTTKVSNLGKEELGDLGMSVRDCMRIALMANTFGHPKFAQFFSGQARIVNDSAMSKDGWFTELFVTSKKYASKSSSSSINSLPHSKNKWKMFTSKNHSSQENQ